MRLAHLILAGLIFGLASQGLLAADRRDGGRQHSAKPAPAQQAPAQANYSFVLDLGADEKLVFVWIKPLRMWAGRYEVSNGQFRRYDAAHDSTNVVGRDMDTDVQPVVNVSWEDAHNYCGWLNRRYGSLIPPNAVFRLPTEQEWETYARCGDQRTYPWGNQWPPPGSYNYRGTEGSGFIYSLFQREQFIRGHDDGYVVSAPVTKSGANEWGLFGVGGNVWEWCENWWDADQAQRAIRGAAWNNEKEATLRVAHRAASPPDSKNESIGFRVVIGPPMP